MAHHVAVCNVLHTRFQGKEKVEFFYMITVNESSVFHYNSESKQHSSPWKTSTSSVSKKAKVVRSAENVTMIIFFYEEGVLYQKTVHQSHIVTTIVLPRRSLAKNDLNFQKKTLTKRLKKFVCITIMHAHMLHTSSPNFWKDEVSDLFHTLHITQILHIFTVCKISLQFLQSFFKIFQNNLTKILRASFKFYSS